MKFIDYHFNYADCQLVRIKNTYRFFFNHFGSVFGVSFDQRNLGNFYNETLRWIRKGYHHKVEWEIDNTQYDYSVSEKGGFLILTFVINSEPKTIKVTRKELLAFIRFIENLDWE